ncbi:RnfH family protein [Paucibacter sp. APW11]|uniref:UPF0125 protein RQP53_07970 n=1 Tax=Roseateles aquae TaxID=3077235 RepID=A0ABU3PAA1_9BURK|nr:RnfH family protein [Paucibacter sp. APW11]MDT8999202.1 RnfH family protein [Paucibacter sp. APW11]
MASAEISVELVWSPRRGDVRRCVLSLPLGATIESALRGCGEFGASNELPLEQLRIGVWGRQQALHHALRDRDRIEVYRALTVDPKEARRQRYRATGTRIVSRHRPLGGKTTR